MLHKLVPIRAPHKETTAFPQPAVESGTTVTLLQSPTVPSVYYSVPTRPGFHHPQAMVSPVKAHNSEHCYHCHRLPWPPPSPFPLGVTINLPPSCLLLKDSQTPPLASPVLQKAKNKSTRSQGRMELRTASHCLTCTLALRVPGTPWREPSFRRKTSFSYKYYKYSMAFFLTFQNSPSPEISSWTGNGP